MKSISKKQKKNLYRIIVAIGLVLALVLLEQKVVLPIWASAALYLVPYFVIGYDILRKAIKGIMKGQPFDENFLMAVATVGAMCLGEFREGVAVMVFYQMGELFESIAVGRSRENIAALMDIRPDYANVMVDGKLEQVDPDDVEIGTQIIVNPGERIPIDGQVVDGFSTVNTSALTGESLPREVGLGDVVMSGCINMSGTLTIETTKEFGESTASKILELVENSSMKKSKSENFITRFARYYTPIVCYSAVALALIPPVVSLIMGAEPMWSQWVIRALTFLVISCPCALVISVPLSFFGGIGCASSKGILVKGSDYLELLSKVRYLMFDKTGTLTKGVFQVTDIVGYDHYTKEQVLEMAAYAESGSSHPISLSLKEAYEESGKTIDLGRVSEIEEIAGHGVKVTFDGQKVCAGNEKLMKLLGVAVDQASGSDHMGTTVFVTVDGQLVGMILIADVIKDNTKAAISKLKASGIKKTIMLTGDSDAAAQAIGKEAGVDQIFSQLLPQDKVTKVEEVLELCEPKELVAFVGDGINDAPVLSRADIGIAMGALGSDAAIEAADVVLMDDDPEKISLAMKISRKTIRIVKENIVFALLVKAICLVLGALGIANMWIAIFADVGVMMIAVINATRALRMKG